jgi:hypothetical protein
MATRGIGEAGQKVLVLSSDDDENRELTIEGMEASNFYVDQSGKPIGLVGPRVEIATDPMLGKVVHQPHTHLEDLTPNPWADLMEPDADGDFTAQGSQRRLAETVAFEAATSLIEAAEDWAGRHIPWGDGGQLRIDPYAFIGMNGLLSAPGEGTAHVHFGILPLRDAVTGLLFPAMSASSWDLVAHEASHHVHMALDSDKEMGPWVESFGDQGAMWASLRDPDRVARVLEATGGNLRIDNPLSLFCEGLAWDKGEVALPDGTQAFLDGTLFRKAWRNANNDLTLDQVPAEPHDQGEVFTGACYRIFEAIFHRFVERGMSQADAMREAADVMGQFLVGAVGPIDGKADLESAAQAYLAVDAARFGGQYRKILSAEFEKRGLID